MMVRIFVTWRIKLKVVVKVKEEFYDDVTL